MNKKIITFSRRTDGALYIDWLIDKLKKGFCYYPNPVTNKAIKEILTPELVLFLSIWTKAPHIIVKNYDILKKFLPLSFQITITGYGNILEKNVPETDISIKGFKDISLKLSDKKLIDWRYDPVIFSKKLDKDWHIRNFTRLCSELKGYTERVIISYVQFDNSYNEILVKLKKNAGIYNDEIHFISKIDFLEFALNLYNIAQNFGIKLQICCNPHIDKIKEPDLSKKFGFLHGACISEELVKIFDPSIKIGKTKGQRPECLCRDTRDIGAYYTCDHGCIYCYANRYNRKIIKIRNPEALWLSNEKFN